METVDNVVLDGTNPEFYQAYELIKMRAAPLVFLTGKAGTGKTTFLKYLRKTLNRNIVVVSYTGVAAINAGGQTINSFFQIQPQSIFLPGDRRLRVRAPQGDPDRSTIYDHFKYNEERWKVIQQMDLLVIDEVSMVRADMLDVVEQLLKVFRGKGRETLFGGVQVLLIGDAFQLPPIAKQEEWSVLETIYESPFFFSSLVMKHGEPIFIELKKVYRQKEQEFIQLLDKVRINACSATEISRINSRYDPTFVPAEESNYITLATHNWQVETINRDKLLQLRGELLTFTGIVQGTFPISSMPTEYNLTLKPGAQIMFVKNNWQQGYYNGTLGKVTEIEGGNIFVKYEHCNSGAQQTIKLERATWKNIKYGYNSESKKVEEQEIGSYTQYPIRLAWAVTVHKSQGLTFERVLADLAGAFSHGQVYVALSRCTTFNGLKLKSQVTQRSIITDPRVVAFAQTETPATLIVNKLKEGQADHEYRQTWLNARLGNGDEALTHLLSALRYRNDMETSSFRRAVNILGNKLRLNAQRIIMLTSAWEWHKTVIQKHEYEIQFQKERAENLSKLLDEANELLERSKKLVVRKDQEVKDIKTALLKTNKSLQDLSDLLASSRGEVVELRANDKLQKMEIARLKSRKWYQLLFKKER